MITRIPNGYDISQQLWDKVQLLGDGYERSFKRFLLESSHLFQLGEKISPEELVARVVAAPLTEENKYAKNFVDFFSKTFTNTPVVYNGAILYVNQEYAEQLGHNFEISRVEPHLNRGGAIQYQVASKSGDVLAVATTSDEAMRLSGLLSESLIVPISFVTDKLGKNGRVRKVDPYAAVYNDGAFNNIMDELVRTLQVSHAQAKFLNPTTLPFKDWCYGVDGERGMLSKILAHIPKDFDIYEADIFGRSITFFNRDKHGDYFIETVRRMAEQNKETQPPTKEEYFRKIAAAWGHKGTDQHLQDMGSGLYNRYCLGDDYSGSAKDYPLMEKLCDELMSALGDKRANVEHKNVDLRLIYYPTKVDEGGYVEKCLNNEIPDMWSVYSVDDNGIGLETWMADFETEQQAMSHIDKQYAINEIKKTLAANQDIPVVYDEHTLGILNKRGEGYNLQFLHTSKLKGSYFSPTSGFASVVHLDKIRLATLKDFQEYRVNPNGYKLLKQSKPVGPTGKHDEVKSLEPAKKITLTQENDCNNNHLKMGR